MNLTQKTNLHLSIYDALMLLPSSKERNEIQKFVTLSDKELTTIPLSTLNDCELYPLTPYEWSIRIVETPLRRNFQRCLFQLSAWVPQPKFYTFRQLLESAYIQPYRLKYPVQFHTLYNNYEKHLY